MNATNHVWQAVLGCEAIFRRFGGQDWEDLRQAVCLRLLRRRSPPETITRAYVAKICFHLVVDAGKKAWPHTLDDTQDFVTLDDSLEQVEVQDFIDSLSPQCRDLVQSRLAGFTLLQASAFSGYPYTFSKRVAQDLRERLRSLENN